MFYVYNNIVLKMARTHDLSFEAQYSTDGMDYLYTRVRIDIGFQINPQATAYIIASNAPVLTPGTLPSTTVPAIRHSLLQPRQQLTITDYLGQTMLECPANGFIVDAKDGPKPISCTITEISGAKTFVGRWVCECHIIECLAGGDPPLIISNRWSDSHHINESQLTTRVASGRTVFRRDWLESLGDGFDQLDNYRDSFPLPDVPPGFQRIAVDIIENSTGNEAMWRVTDQERMIDIGETDPSGDSSDDDPMLGSGILAIDGSQTIQSVPTGSSGPTAGATVNSIVLRAKGSKEANQWTMLESLIKLSFSLYNAIGPNWITNGSMSRSLGQDEKWVELKLAIYQNPAQVIKDGAGNIDPGALRADVFFIYGDHGGVNPNLLHDNSTRGTALVQLLVQELTDSCQVSGELQAGGSLGGEPIPPVGPPPAVSTGTSDTLPEEPSSYDMNGRNDSTYTTYKIETKVDTNPGILQAPISGLPPQSQSGGFGQTSAIFRLHQPISRMTVAGYAECINQNPLLPLPEPTDPNYVLMHPWYITPSYPVVLNNGQTPVTRVDFLFTYALLSPVDSTSPNIIVGSLPWTTIPGSIASLNESDFNEEITGI